MKHEVAHKRTDQTIKLGTINKYTTEHGTKYHLRHFKELSTAGRDTESIYWLHADNIFHLDVLVTDLTLWSWYVS